jgi:CBS domain-containing protein
MSEENAQTDPPALPKPPDSEKAALRRRIKESLRAQGFVVKGGRVELPKKIDKPTFREMHQLAVAHRREKARRGLERYEPDLLRRIANGREINTDAVTPRLVEVTPGSEEELLFRYVAIHWSIPVSSGYGRRLRFLVVDDENDKLIGIFGLGDPVFNLGVRDEWIGWDSLQRRTHLQHVMEAFVVGAVPPYSELLAGKLVAMLLAADEVRAAFERKYANKTSLISGRSSTGQLVLITTQSALGRSSIYNRAKHRDRLLLQPIGFTAGYGEFQFANGLYQVLTDYAGKYCRPTAKAAAWGEGFRNRREVIRKSLVSLELPSQWSHHGIKREVFAVPLAANARAVLRGETNDPDWRTASADDLANWWRERWLRPRAARRSEYLRFERSSYGLWR